MRSAISILFLVSGLLFAGALQAKEYYKWVDDDGVTHYTVTAPKDRPSELVRVVGGAKAPKSTSKAASASQALPGDETGFNAPKPKAAEPAKTAEAKMSVIDPARCQVARGNIETLTNHPRIRVTDPDGSIRYLTDAEKAEKMAEAEAAVRESCE